MPEQLVAMVREHHPAATLWEALARSGRVGYKHCGLEVHVVDAGEHTAEDVAGAVLAMVAKHHGSTGCALYRINARDEAGDLCGDPLALRMADDGEADDATPEVAGAPPKWVIDYLKAIQAAHIQTLQAMPGVMTIAKDAMEAMANAIGEVCEVRWEQSGEDADDRDRQRKHERSMQRESAFLDMFMPYIASSMGGARRSPLADLLATMPDEVKTALRECLGTALFDDLVAVAAIDDTDARKLALVEVAKRITPEMKAAMGARIPEQWQSQITSALRAELAS